MKNEKHVFIYIHRTQIDVYPMATELELTTQCNVMDYTTWRINRCPGIANKGCFLI